MVTSLEKSITLTRGAYSVGKFNDLHYGIGNKLERRRLGLPHNELIFRYSGSCTWTVDYFRCCEVEIKTVTANSNLI